ncbi:MAG: serpin family protein [Chthoniobacteraceae bacterium]
MKLLPLLFLALFAVSPLKAADASVATTAINSLGIDLLKNAASSNTLLSPYSIQFALAMTYAGADGETRQEMQRVLHYPADDAMLNDSFHALNGELETMVKTSATATRKSRSDHAECCQSALWAKGSGFPTAVSETGEKFLCRSDGVAGFLQVARCGPASN